MSNLKLVPDAPTPLEKLLLDASRAEAPSEDHKAKLRAVLGIGLPLSGPASVPPASGAGSGNHAAAGGAAPSAAAGIAAATKSATLGKIALGIAAVALVGAFVLLQKPAPQVPVAPVSPAPVRVAATLPVAPAVEAAPAVSPLPPVEAAPAAAPRIARTEASSSAAADLSEQIRLIEAARSGVAAHDSKAAVAALDSYAAKFPRGSFGQEATVLRIRAFDQAGDAARATAMAKSFIARFPNSPHVARLKPIAERGALR